MIVHEVVGLKALVYEEIRISSGIATIRAESDARSIASTGNRQFSGVDGCYVVVACDCFALRVKGYYRHCQVESAKERD